MTHYILNPNSSFASQVTSTNAIYEICHDFNLNNAQVTIGLPHDYGFERDRDF